MNAPSSDSLRPFDARMLDVGDGHWIYVEEVGLKGGKPVIFLHGGPGSGCQHMHRAIFDPARDHVFFLDQRGAGRSHPHLSCRANTTAHLIGDLETVRQHFGIDRWLVVGGSWGSTLALAYAEAHPARVTGLVLRAIFLGTAREVEWAFVDAPRMFRPELFAAFRDRLPKSERGDPLSSYLARLSDGDPAIQTPAAHIFNAYERTLSEIAPRSKDIPATFETNSRLPPTPIVEAHYILSNFFLMPGELLANAYRLAGIPGVIVQGRYDLLCAPANAFALVEAWPDAEMQLIDNAGHSMTEPGVMDAMRTGVTKLQSAAMAATLPAP